MLSLALIGLALLLVSGATREFSRLVNDSEDAHRLEDATRVFHILEGDLDRSLSVSLPSSWALRLEQVDTTEERFPWPPPPSWSPERASVTVEYSMSEGRLLRQGQILLEDLSGFSCSVLENGNLEIQLSYQERGRLLNLRRQFFLLRSLP